MLIGGGGHGASVLDAARLTLDVAGVVCTGDPVGLAHAQIEHLGTDDWLLAQDPTRYCLLNGVGLVPGTTGRIDVWSRFSDAGFMFETVIHPTAYVSDHATVEAGAQILGGAQVNAGAHLGKNCTVNTGVIVEHHVQVGAHAHLATGVMTAGGVTIGEAAFVGAGSVVIPDVKIGAGAVIAAGGVVTNDVPERVRVAGIPARPMLE